MAIVILKRMVFILLCTLYLIYTYLELRRNNDHGDKNYINVEK